MKKFIDERKRLTMRHYKQVECLKKVHQEQLEKFAKESSKVSEAETNVHFCLPLTLFLLYAICSHNFQPS